MKEVLPTLVARLDDERIKASSVISWSSPVPSFGDCRRATVATLGLNPSNREFVDVAGKELNGRERRFHTLTSFGLSQWTDALPHHLHAIERTCCDYFENNPYDRWFKKLDSVIGGTRSSFYSRSSPACHIDLIPYATDRKWASLRRSERGTLLGLARDTLGLLLRHSSVKLLILNGSAVVRYFEEASGIELKRRTMPSWALPRSTGHDVTGRSFAGRVSRVNGIDLQRELLVLGFNHNVQSSFGVTTSVLLAIRSWLAKRAREATA